MSPELTCPVRNSTWQFSECLRQGYSGKRFVEVRPTVGILTASTLNHAIIPGILTVGEATDTCSISLAQLSWFQLKGGGSGSVTRAIVLYIENSSTGKIQNYDRYNNISSSLIVFSRVH
jgi:hypothetical protein